MTSRTQQALTLYDQGKCTAYRAARTVGISPATLYKALKIREKKRARPVCPKCGQPIGGVT